MEGDYCRKVKFKTERKALNAITRINNNPQKNQKCDLKTAYKCEVCKSWHVSSMEPKYAKRVNDRKEMRDAMENPSLSVIQKRIEYLKTSYRVKNKFN